MTEYALTVLLFMFFVLVVSLFLLVSYKNKLNKNNDRVIKELQKIEYISRQEKEKIKSTPITNLGV